MPGNELSERELQYLLNLEKSCKQAKKYSFPAYGGKITVDLRSADKKEDFTLDIWWSSINLSRTNFQNRARRTLVLLRLDINSAPHKNPDGQAVGRTHLHIYKPGYGDKYAYPLPEEFDGCGNPRDLFDKFMDYCHITGKPVFEEDLFI